MYRSLSGAGVPAGLALSLALWITLGASHARAQAPGKWMDVAPFPDPREEVMGEAANGKMYVFAGLIPLWHPAGLVYEYDPATNQWTKKKPMALPSHHVAFTYAGLDDLTGNYLRLKAIGIGPHRCVNHGVTTSMYYYDPDHNQVELLVDNFATAAEGQAYMRSRSTTDKNPVGIVYDPEELVGRVRAGLRVEELASIN